MKAQKKKKKKARSRAEGIRNIILSLNATFAAYFFFVLSVEGLPNIFPFSMWQNLFSIFVPLVICWEIMLFDIFQL